MRRLTFPVGHFETRLAARILCRLAEIAFVFVPVW